MIGGSDVGLRPNSEAGLADVEHCGRDVQWSGRTDYPLGSYFPSKQKQESVEWKR